MRNYDAFRTRRRKGALIASCGMALALAVVVPAPASSQTATTSQAAPSSPNDSWRVIESVLTHPRCTNCHTATDYPRQGDDRRRHQFRVVRGPDDRGVPGALCAACHQEDNQASSGVPGAPNWRLAPRSMAFERAPGVAMSGKELCERLLDKKRNGNLGLRGMELHLARESLVLWAWSPGILKDGTPRMTPPVSQEELSNAFKAWSAALAPCPK
jgi:hypothetical protein